EGRKAAQVAVIEARREVWSVSKDRPRPRGVGGRMLSLVPKSSGRDSTREKTMNRTRKAVVGGALAACTLLGGGIGAALLNGTANAQTSTSTTAARSTAQPAPPSGQPPANFDPTKGGHA